MRREIDTLCQRIEKLDKISRRKNLIIHGLTESQGETQNDLDNTILSLISNVLQISDFTKSEIDYIRRFGSATESSRPVIFGLTTERRKFEILRNSKSLKGTKIYIRQDLTDKDREERRTLVTQMKKERENGNFAVIRKNKLIIKPKHNKDDNIMDYNQGTGNSNNKRALSESPKVNTGGSKKKVLQQSKISGYIPQILDSSSSKN